MNHPLLTVVWIAGSAYPFLAVHGSTITAQGITISLADVNSGLGQNADLRVLPTWALADVHGYRAEYKQHSRPTLLLGRSADEVADLLEIALDDDEVGHAQEPPAVLVERLRRLQRRDDSRRAMEQVGHRDELTSLWNRRRLDDALEQLPHQMPTKHGVTGLIRPLQALERHLRPRGR